MCAGGTGGGSILSARWMQFPGESRDFGDFGRIAPKASLAPAEEARANASAANLARMKKEAVGRDDKDVTDDVVGGVNIGAARNQRAAEGRAAREAEEARYTQSAADLSRMKKEAVGRDDKGRW